MSRNILIACFSRGGGNYMGGKIVSLPAGNTESAAKMAAALTGGGLLKIDPAKKYPPDYHACTEEAQKDLRANVRPELTSPPDSIDGYDTVILGYPNDWGTMPMPVWTFLDHLDFSGKAIFPFCIHEGSGMGRNGADIRRLCPGAAVQKGLAIRGRGVSHAESDIAVWLNAIR